jgi:hypothetical protein
MTAPADDSRDPVDAAMALLLRHIDPTSATGFLARVPWVMRLYVEMFLACGKLGRLHEPAALVQNCIVMARGLAARHGDTPHGCNEGVKSRGPVPLQTVEVPDYRIAFVLLRDGGKVQLDPIGLHAVATLNISTNRAPATRIVLHRMLLQACAAADAGVHGMTANPAAKPKYEYVPILVGTQGAKKSSFIHEFVPRDLRQYVRESTTIDADKPDSVKQAISYWICELGEIDVTFTRNGISEMKAFLSRYHDVLRLPYLRCTSDSWRGSTPCRKSRASGPSGWPRSRPGSARRGSSSVPCCLTSGGPGSDGGARLAGIIGIGYHRCRGSRQLACRACKDRSYP